MQLGDLKKKHLLSCLDIRLHNYFFISDAGVMLSLSIVAVDAPFMYPHASHVCDIVTLEAA